MLKNYTILLDLTTDSRTSPILNINTNDLNTIKLAFIVTEKGQVTNLTGATARIAVKKPDNKTVFQDCEITDGVEGKCEVVLDSQSYAVPGRCEAELMLYRNTDTVAVTGRFAYIATKGILDDKTIESTNEFQSINKAIADAENILIDLRENGTGIDAQARQDLVSVSAQLAQTMTVAETSTVTKNRIPNNEIPSSKLATTNQNDRIKLVNLHEEVHAAMTGQTSVGNVPENGSVTIEKLAPQLQSMFIVEGSAW